MKKNYKNILLIFAIVLALIFLYIHRDAVLEFLNTLVDKERLKKYFTSIGHHNGMIVFVILQIVQVVIFFLPGQVIQVLGGYLYGTLQGTVLSTIGIAIGSTLLFLISRKFSQHFSKKLKKDGIFNKTKDILSCKKGKFIILLIYFIPGMPKDNMIYVCAMTDMKFKTFITYSMLGRIPDILFTSLIGTQLDKGNTSVAVILIVLIILAFVIAFLKKDAIIRSMSGNESTNV